MENILTLSKFEKLDLSNFILKIKDKVFIDRVKDFLTTFHKKYQNTNNMFDDVVTRKILSAYLIYFHKNEILTDGDQYSERIFELSANYILSFNKFFINKNMGLFKDYYMNLGKFLKFFDIWKKRDSLIMARPMIATYHEIKEALEEEKMDEEQRIEYLQMMGNLRKRVIMIAGLDGKRCLDTGKFPIFTDEKIFTEVENTIKKAFWDLFESRIRDKKYNNLYSILEELRDMLFELIPNRKDLHKEFHDKLDLSIIKQLLEVIGDNEIDKKLLLSIFNIFIHYIKMLQAASDDEDTKLFVENFNEKLEHESQEKLLRFFFETAFNKLEKIKSFIERFKKAAAKMSPKS